MKKNRNPKVTIVIVVLNGVSTIEQAINSIIIQTYINTELIILDGGSTDGTVELIRKYEQYITYWHSKPDRGIYDAMNNAVELSKGEYILFLGADDAMYDIDTIDKVIKFYNGFDLISGGVFIVDERTGYERYISSLNQEELEKYDGHMVPHQGLISKRKILKQFPFDTNYKVVADQKFFLQCFFDTSVKKTYIDFPIAYYSSDGISANPKQKLREEWKIMSEFSRNLSISIIIKVKTRIIIKWLIELTGIYGFMKKIKNQRYVKIHRCNNKICRWCKKQFEENKSESVI